MRLGGYCPGCGGGEGNQGCAIARCSLTRGGLEYCWQCGEFPCVRYREIDRYDSFITHQNQLAVNLLELEELRKIMERLAAEETGLPPRERAVLAASLCKVAAARREIDLRLRKAPGKTAK